MKNLVILLTLLFPIITNAQISDRSTDTCKVIGSFAKETMGARQNNRPYSGAIKIVNSAPQSFRPLAKNIVDDAYKYPLAKSKNAKETVIEDFSDKYILMCFTSMTS